MGRLDVEIDIMELMFNELSYSEGMDLRDYIGELSLIHQKLKDYNVTTCRISDDVFSKLISTIDWKDRIHRDQYIFLSSFFKRPYESSGWDDKNEAYVNFTWKYGSNNCEGLAWAYIFQSPALSLLIDPWKVPNVTIQKNDQDCSVQNIFSKDFPDYTGDCIDEDVSLTECMIPVEQKSCNIRDDHGKDVLLEYSPKILKSPYVIEVINSLPFQPHDRQYIRKIENNGIIHITLPWTDSGLGLAIRTTGRNYLETKCIAHKLEEEYSFR